MLNTVAKAVVLAAGKGTRMAALTQSVPKPMLPLNGRPLLHHVLDRLKAAGIRQALLVIGAFGDQIRQYAPNFPMPVEFVEQHELNGTASATLLGASFAGNQPFLLTFGDILSTPEDYRGMIAALDPTTEAVLAAKHTEDPYQGAAIYHDSGIITRIIEKPPKGASTTPWNSAGIYIFRPSIFTECARVPVSPRGEYEITSAVTQLLDAGRKVKMHALAGAWLDVGRPGDLETAQAILK